jgi:hypothetical protein
MGKAEFVSYSFDVKAEGKNVPRALDLMLHNNKNTPPSPVIQPPLIVIGVSKSDSGSEQSWDLEKIEIL